MFLLLTFFSSYIPYTKVTIDEKPELSDAVKQKIKSAFDKNIFPNVPCFNINQLNSLLDIAKDFEADEKFRLSKIGEHTDIKNI